MLRILSVLAALPFALAVLVAVGLYTAYGQVDPCRALAAQRTRQAEAEMGAGADKTIGPWMRSQTSQLSTGQCAREMVRSFWGGGSEEQAQQPDDEQDRQYGDEPDYHARDYGDYDDDSGYERDGD